MDSYSITPLQTPQGSQEVTQHVCLGISPFNSYFSTPRIASLIQWAMPRFEKIDFYVPDEAAAYTLQALGYERDVALHKARRQGNYVKNKIKKACVEVGLEDGPTRIYDAARLREIPTYMELHSEAKRRFEEDPILHEAIMTTSSWILDKRLPDGVAPTEEQNLLAVQYFLEELPMFIDTPSITNVESSTFIYHQRVDFLERMYAHELPWQPVSNQVFWVVSEEVKVPTDVQTETLKVVNA